MELYWAPMLEHDYEVRDDEVHSRAHLVSETSQMLRCMEVPYDE